MKNFLSNTPTTILVLICAIGFAVIFALMQFFLGPAFNLSRGTALWIMVGLQLLLIFVIFMPRLSRAVGGSKALLLFAVVLGVGAAMYVYIVNVRVPAAVTQNK